MVRSILTFTEVRIGPTSTSAAKRESKYGSTSDQTRTKQFFVQ